MANPMACPYLTCIFLLLCPLVFTATVTLDDDIPFEAHDCVNYCLDARGYFGSYTDVGEALSCGDPYEEGCYCATASASAKTVSAFFNECVSESCASGDRTADISSIRGLYASYCIHAGYTQPIITEWYTAAAGPSSGSGDGTTTLATPSRTSSPGSEKTTSSESTTDAQDVDRETSAAAPTPEESTTSGHGGTDNGKSIGLGVGLGVGLAIVLVAASVFIYLCIRNRKRQQHLSNYNAYAQRNEPKPQDYAPSGAWSPPPATSVSNIKRKPVLTPSLPTSPSVRSGEGELASQQATGNHEAENDAAVPQATTSMSSRNTSRHEMFAECSPQEVEDPRSRSHRYELPSQ